MGRRIDAEVHSGPAAQRSGQIRQPLLVLQHVRYEPPAEYEAVLMDRALPFDRVILDEGEQLPDRHGYAGIIAMGGPMSANDHDAHPWLVPEKQLIREEVRAGTPFWGICLGAQILASALGARVFTGDRPEVGMGDVTRSGAALHDPVFAALPDPSRVFQWHSDSFDLPAGGLRLASSSDYRNQAFCVGSAYGLQFHLEVTAELAVQWLAIPEYARALDAALGPDAAPGMMSDLHASLPTTLQLARTLFNKWLDTFVLADDSRSSTSSSLLERSNG